jgi:hypothetical protein
MDTQKRACEVNDPIKVIRKIIQLKNENEHEG